jgi:hypothetical protein
VPVGAVARAWRNGRLQVRLARLLSSPDVEVVVQDDVGARAAGQLCGVAGTSDVVDVSVVLCARERGAVVLTSDPRGLARLDPDLRLVVI